MMPPINSPGCIAFKLNHYDTHKSFNSSNKNYTIPVSGKYVFKDNKGKYHELDFYAGDKLITDEIIRSSCGIFYWDAKGKIK